MLPAIESEGISALTPCEDLRNGREQEEFSVPNPEVGILIGGKRQRYLVRSRDARQKPLEDHWG